VVQALFQPQLAQQLHGAGAALGVRHTGVHGRHLHVFHRRAGGDQVVALEHKAELFAPQARQFVTA